MDQQVKQVNNLVSPLGVQHTDQKILILCGLVGSGKSSFACQLERFDANFVRISQDVLGTRPLCEAEARKCLDEGKSIIIDRQNFDRKQRLTWIRIGQEHAAKLGITDLEIDVIEFATPYEECARRLELRTGHETIHSADEGKSILGKVSRQWVPPKLSEGINRHLILVPDSHGVIQSTSDTTTTTRLSFPITDQVIRSVLAKLASIPFSKISPSSDKPKWLAKSTSNMIQSPRRRPTRNVQQNSSNQSTPPDCHPTANMNVYHAIPRHQDKRENGQTEGSA